MFGTTTADLAPYAGPARSTPSRRWLRPAIPAALAALLAACGGGGGSDPSPEVQGPPTTPATLSATPGEAGSSAKAAVAGAEAATSRSGALNGLTALFGEPIVAQQAPVAGRKQILAVQTAPCADLLDTPCSGSATLDTNWNENATTVPAGTYFDLRFSHLSGPLLGNQLALNGRMRMEFQTALNLNASQVNGLDLKLTFDALGGSVNGVTFGPLTDLGRLQISSQGISTLTAGGARYTNLRGVSFTSAGNYSIGSGTVRVSYWADSGAYVDISLTNWRVSGGRPAVGSQAAVSSGSGSSTGSAAISVIASSQTSVVYSVAITLNGVSTAYVVTATYPPGGGAPTYAAVPAVG
jgi:hypothetical protein